MNKLLTVCASLAIITCGSVSAQKKGEVSIGGIIGVSGGYSSVRSAESGTPASTSFSAGGEFGWFSLTTGGSEPLCNMLWSPIRMMKAVMGGFVRTPIWFW